MVMLAYGRGWTRPWAEFRRGVGTQAFRRYPLVLYEEYYNYLFTINLRRNLSPPNLNSKIKSKSQNCSENSVFSRHFPNLDSHQTPIIIKSAVILLGIKVLPDPIFSTRYVPINSYEYAWFHEISR